MLLVISHRVLDGVRVTHVLDRSSVASIYVSVEAVRLGLNRLGGALNGTWVGRQVHNLLLLAALAAAHAANDQQQKHCETAEAVRVPNCFCVRVVGKGAGVRADVVVAAVVQTGLVLGHVARLPVAQVGDRAVLPRLDVVAVEALLLQVERLDARPREDERRKNFHL